MTHKIVFDPPPRLCPACRTGLKKAYPQCPVPSCREPLTPAALKARADRAVDRHGLGLPDPPATVPMRLAGVSP